MKMIFSDIDGTLITSDLCISPRTLSSLKEKMIQGGWVVPVSARMPEAIHPIMKNLGECYPVISYNGALVQDHRGKILFSQTIDSETAFSLCDYLSNYWSRVAWNVYSYDKWYAQNRSNFLTAREEVIVGLESIQIDLDHIKELPGVHKLLLMGEPEEMIRLEEELLGAYSNLSISKSTANYIEVMAEGIDKGQAVTLLREFYGCPLDDTVGFGDNFNDIPMLLAVGQAYVMGNAPKAVKDQIGLVTADHDNDGIALILEELSRSKLR